MRIRSGRVHLELHELAKRSGPSVLLLHALFGSSADWGETPSAWPGPVYALDFAGHGRSEWVSGGAYTPETLAADADAALHKVGSCAVVGAGVGAYVALLVAGARRDAIPAALLLPGAGLSGGGALPDFSRSHAFRGFDVAVPGEPTVRGYDPMVRSLAYDIRPVDYTQQFAGAARHLLLIEDDNQRPPWWEEARCLQSAVAFTADMREAFARLAAAIGAAAQSPRR